MLPDDVGGEAEFPVKMMARVIGVSRSGFYSWLSNGCPREDWSAERERSGACGWSRTAGSASGS